MHFIRNITAVIILAFFSDQFHITQFLNKWVGMGGYWGGEHGWAWLRYYSSLVGMGGHGSDITVHGWAWVGIGHVCVGMYGRGCNLKGKCMTILYNILVNTFYFHKVFIHIQTI